jgi:hypothetical protein
MRATDEASARRPRSWTAPVVLVAVGGVTGAVIGGYLDYGAWHANAAMLAAVPVTLSVLLGVGAAAWWLTSRRRLAGWITLAAWSFFVGTQIGAWIAPSAHRPGYSEGTVSLALTDPPVGSATGTAACFSEAEGPFSVGTDPAQTLAGTTIHYSLQGPGPDGNRGDVGFILLPDPEEGHDRWWGTDVESEGVDVDVLDQVVISGDASAGTALLVAVPANPGSPIGDAFGGPAPAAVNGSLTWTCEPPRGEPTPIEGSWFR